MMHWWENVRLSIGSRPSLETAAWRWRAAGAMSSLAGADEKARSSQGLIRAAELQEQTWFL
jgi:hypothetical protein